MKIRGTGLAGLLAACVVLSANGVARAEEVQCEVLSIRASTDGTAISQSLEPYRPQLMRPPLNAFTSFTLIETRQLRLSAGASQPLTLGNDIGGELRLVSSRPERERLRLRLTLRRGEQTLVNSQVALTRSHPFFVAGPIIPGGTLVVGIVCR